MDQLEDATWDCSECNFLRAIVVWSQMPKTPVQRGIWLRRIMVHEEREGHLVYPKSMMPWQGETIVMAPLLRVEEDVPVAQRTRAGAS